MSGNDTKPAFANLKHPTQGERLSFKNGKPCACDYPIIPFIAGDGSGPDIWKASVRVFDAAVEKSSNGKRKIEWLQVYAGGEAHSKFSSWLPTDTLDAISYYGIAIKGPLTTPVGGGIRSLNVALRQQLDLYACVRPVRFYPHAPSPVKHPEHVDFVLFRENSEDTYCGIEFIAGSPEAKKLIAFLNTELLPQDPSMKGKKIRESSGIGIKPSSRFAAHRLMRRTLEYAIKHKLPSVTIVHKGNIMKYTEGSFKEWCYELAMEEFRDKIILESELEEQSKGIKNTVTLDKDKIIIRDRIADAMLQQILLRPQDYSAIITMNLNGDYLSDAAAAQVGGLGIAPGANIGDSAAIFEATHGTAPKYADKNVVNPSALILSGCLMFQWLGWNETAQAIEAALVKTLEQGKVTYDFARQMENPTTLGTAEFADALIENL